MIIHPFEEDAIIYQAEQERKKELHEKKFDAALTTLGFSEDDKSILEVARDNIEYHQSLRSLNTLKLHFLNHEKTSNYFKSILERHDRSFEYLNRGRSRGNYLNLSINGVVQEVEEKMIKEAENLTSSRKCLVQTLTAINGKNVKQR